MAEKVLRFKDVYKEGHPLKFSDMHSTEYRPGEDELINYRAYRRKRTHGVGEGGPVSESTFDPASGQHQKGVTPGYGYKHKIVKDPGNPKHHVHVHQLQGEDANNESVWVNRQDSSSSSRENIIKAKKAISQGMPRAQAQAKYLVKTTDLQKKTPKSYGELLKTGRNEETEMDEALNVQQRMARKRLLKRIQPKIKRGRRIQARRIATKERLMKRAMRAARRLMLKRFTKDIPKSELTYARRQDLERRLEKPAIKKRISMVARKLFPKVRNAELKKKRASRDPK